MSEQPRAYPIDEDIPRLPVEIFGRTIWQLTFSSIHLDRTVTELAFEPGAAYVRVAITSGFDPVSVGPIPFLAGPREFSDLLAVPAGLDPDPAKWFDPWSADDLPPLDRSLPTPDW